MEKINFLPNSIKEKKLRKKELRLICMDVFLFILIVGMSIHMVYVKKALNTLKKDVELKRKPVEVKVDINNKEKALNFMEANKSVLSDYEAISINKNKISLKYKILNEEQFTEKVRSFEDLKNVSVDYLVAPYNEAGKCMFEIGIEILL